MKDDDKNENDNETNEYDNDHEDMMMKDNVPKNDDNKKYETKEKNKDEEVKWWLTRKKEIEKEKKSRMNRKRKDTKQQQLNDRTQTTITKWVKDKSKADLQGRDYSNQERGGEETWRKGRRVGAKQRMIRGKGGRDQGHDNQAFTSTVISYPYKYLCLL